MKAVEKTQASHLVIRTMENFVAHDYLEEGGWELLECIHTKRGKRFSGMDHFVLIAEMENQIVGTIEIRKNNHIALFCVEEKYRQRGIGRKLLKKALELCAEHNPELSEVNVNSLPGSVNIYERLGFHAEELEKKDTGTPYMPMHIALSKAKKFKSISSHEYEAPERSWRSLSRAGESPTYILYDG
jgi:GNAT superfamily N-acetyltransferase